MAHTVTSRRCKFHARHDDSCYGCRVAAGKEGKVTHIVRTKCRNPKPPHVPGETAHKRRANGDYRCILCDVRTEKRAFVPEVISDHEVKAAAKC